MRHRASSSDEEFSLLLAFLFKVFRFFLLTGCLAVGFRFRFSFSICCSSNSFFSGLSVKMAHFHFLLFALVFFRGGAFGSGAKISGDILGPACVQS